MEESKKQRFKRIAVSRIKAVNDAVTQMKIELDGKSKKKEGFNFD